MKKKNVNLQGQKLYLSKIRIVGLSAESFKYIGGGADTIVAKPTTPLPQPPKPNPETKPPTVSVSPVSRDSLYGGHDCTVAGPIGNN